MLNVTCLAFGDTCLKGINRYYIFNKKYNLNISLYITYNEIPFCYSV